MVIDLNGELVLKLINEKVCAIRKNGKTYRNIHVF